MPDQAQGLKHLCFCARSGVKYGFTLAVLEGPKTIPTLWDVTQDFMGKMQTVSPARSFSLEVTLSTLTCCGDTAAYHRRLEAHVWTPQMRGQSWCLKQTCSTL